MLWKVFQVVLYQTKTWFWANRFSSKYRSFLGITKSCWDDDIEFPVEPRASQPLSKTYFTTLKRAMRCRVLISGLSFKKGELECKEEFININTSVTFWDEWKQKRVSFKLQHGLWNTMEDFLSQVTYWEVTEQQGCYENHYGQIQSLLKAVLT